MADRELITIIEGSKGKAEVYEVPEGPGGGTITSGVASSTYEVVCGSERQSKIMTLGEASIIAHELAGAS